MSAYHVLCPSLYETTAAMCSFFITYLYISGNTICKGLHSSLMPIRFVS